MKKVLFAVMFCAVAFTTVFAAGKPNSPAAYPVTLSAGKYYELNNDTVTVWNTSKVKVSPSVTVMKTTKVESMPRKQYEQMQAKQK